MVRYFFCPTGCVYPPFSYTLNAIFSGLRFLVKWVLRIIPTLNWTQSRVSHFHSHLPPSIQYVNLISSFFRQDQPSESDTDQGELVTSSKYVDNLFFVGSIFTFA